MRRPVDKESTPEGLLAAVASNLLFDMRARLKHEPDYADFRDALQPYLERELLTARLREIARTDPGALSWEWRKSELRNRLEALERVIKAIEG